MPVLSVNHVSSATFTMWVPTAALSRSGRPAFVSHDRRRLRCAVLPPSPWFTVSCRHKGVPSSCGPNGRSTVLPLMAEQQPDGSTCKNVITQRYRRMLLCSKIFRHQWRNCTGIT